MSQELEQRVIDLTRLQERRRETGREKYRADKEYKSTEKEVTAMLRSGHTMPQDSDYFAELIEEGSGRLNYKYVVDEMQERYPKMARVIEDLKRESREMVVERLHYGTSTD